MTQKLNSLSAMRALCEGNAVVVGAGRSGIAAARFLLSKGATVRLVDAGESISDAARQELEGVEIQLGAHSPEQFADADIIVLSPGVPVRKLAPYLEGVDPKRIVAEIEMACWFTQTPIIAVTGSNGKTTTATLAAAMLKQSGKKVFLGGNIGTPLSQFLLEDGEADVLVLEVSSFQLQNCRFFAPRVAILLNVSPNHLDWHVDMDEYVDAKLNIFRAQKSGDLAVIHESMHEQLNPAEFCKAEVKWFGNDGPFVAPKLFGKHNRGNISAAWIAASTLGADNESAAIATREFQPLEHRLELVGELDGVMFINDTKATTLTAVEAAVRSFDNPIMLLMGGKFKGGDVEALANAMQGRVARIALYGGSRDIFEKPFSRYFTVTWDSTLEEATRRLKSFAHGGEVILLAPGTSSFDQYNNYMERGADFKRIFGEMK